MSLLVSRARYGALSASAVRMAGGGALGPRWNIPEQDYHQYTYQPTIPDKAYAWHHLNYSPFTYTIRISSRIFRLSRDSCISRVESGQRHLEKYAIYKILDCVGGGERHNFITPPLMPYSRLWLRTQRPYLERIGLSTWGTVNGVWNGTVGAVLYAWHDSFPGFGCKALGVLGMLLGYNVFVMYLVIAVSSV